jgi:2'-hydroxyisoflavone reductase
MKLLLLGGTRFLGRHLAEQALARGDEVTLVHRGRSAGRGLLPGAEHLVGDRDHDLPALLGPARRWDVAIDTSAYLPRQVSGTAALLAGRVGQYQLVSSISAYASNPPEGNDEGSPRAVLDDPATETIDGSTYGGLKALCEDAAVAEPAGFGAARTLVVRPGLIVGPFDPTGRFSWWVQRLQRGGEVLAPGDPAAPVQFIDARDLAAWMLAQADAGTAGAFNLTGPTSGLGFGAFLQAALATLAPPATRLVWVDEAAVLAAGVAPWADLPVWLSTPDQGLHRTRIDRAMATGLRTRPLADTLRDTAAWLADAPAVAPGRPAVGLSPEREAALLAGAAPGPR